MQLSQDQQQLLSQDQQQPKYLLGVSQIATFKWFYGEYSLIWMQKRNFSKGFMVLTLIN